jgi:hypothetical protein
MPQLVVLLTARLDDAVMDALGHAGPALHVVIAR